MKKKMGAAKKKSKQEESALELVDGEVLDMPTPEAVSLTLDVSNKDLLAELKALKNTDEDEMIEGLQDLWKPKEEGDSLVGVYGGRFPDGKYFAHVFMTEHPKTEEPQVQRIRASRVLDKMMAQVPVGRGCIVRYLGQGKTEDGFRLNSWAVKMLPTKR